MEKNKTALQELLNELEEVSKVGNNPFIITTVNLIRDMVEDKLEKEKEQIEDAWRHGAIRSPENLKHINNSSLYYKEKHEINRKEI